MRSRVVNRIALIFSAIFSIGAIAEETGASYLDDRLFLEIKDVNRQAESWAMCAATYDFMAAVLSEAQPARSRQLKDIANGAEMAVIMSMVSDGLDSEMTQERFYSLWTMAKLAGSELPLTRRTMLAADAESSSDKKGAKVFFANLSATMSVCVKNLEAQQMYIDTWRELAKSGLLKLPSE